MFVVLTKITTIMVLTKLLNMPVGMPAYSSLQKSDVWGGVAAGAGSLLGGLVNGLFGNHQQNKALEAQWKMMQNAMNWQHNERLESQSFNSVEAQKLRDWQEKLVNQQNEYNSVGSQVRRAIKAGVNPYSMISPTGSSAASAPSGASASSSGWPSVSWAPNYASQALGSRAAMLSSVTSGVSDIAGAIEKIASAKKLGVDTEYIQRGMNDMLRNLSLDAAGKELANNYQQWINDNAPQLRKAQLDTLNAEMRLLLSEKDLNSDKSKEIIARIGKLVADTRVSNSEADRLTNYVQKYQDADMRSQIGLRQAEAGLAREQTITEGAKQDYLDQQTETSYANQKQVEALTQYQNIVNEIKQFGKRQEKVTTLRRMEEELLQYGIITETMREKLQTAINNNDWYTYNQIMNGINMVWGNLNGTIGSLTGAGSNAVNYDTGYERTRTYGADGKLTITTEREHSRERGKRRK